MLSVHIVTPAASIDPISTTTTATRTLEVSDAQEDARKPTLSASPASPAPDDLEEAEEAAEDSISILDNSHWSQISSFQLSEGLSVEKYRSALTGLTVVLANAESPIVNGYFCLATEV